MKISNWLEQPRHLFWVLQLGGLAAWGLIGKYGFSVVVLEEIAPHYGYYVAAITTIAVILSLGLRIL
ncbi:MAG: hypothetical protein EXR85_06870 [Xanthomonadales bacterium]|nr:hypothetical protein [Xanthomonadales bacterium]